MIFKRLFFLLFTFFILDFSNAQSYNDGPIVIDVKLREVQGNFAATDEALLGIGFAPDELVFKIWTQDNLLTYPWTGGSCLQDFNFTPIVGGGNSIDFNSTFANFNFPTTTVPQYLNFKIDAWEDDIPSDGLNLGALGGFCNQGQVCDWNDNVCCGVTLFGFCVGIETGDDYRCDANPFYQGLSYRNGPPCQWYSHGYLNGSGCINPSTQSGAPNTDGYYKPHIETFWRYTMGTSFANAIDLGNLNTGVITHFNSNECYTDYYTASSGNDVIYSFNINNPTGVNISLCGANGAQFDSYIYLVKDTSVIALSENDNFCTNQSEISAALCEIGTYYIVVDAVSSTELGTFTLLVSEDPTSSFTLSSSITDASCNSYSDGKINLSLNGGVAPYSYSWYDSNMQLISNSLLSSNSTDSLENLQAASYIIQVSDDDNCILIDTFIVSHPSPLTMLTSSVPASCNSFSDGQVNVVVSGGTPNYNYNWNTNPTQSNANAIFLSAGTYLLTVTDANNCIDTISETITEPSPVPVNISTTSTTVCVGGSVNLQASGALNYNWSPSLWLNTSVGTNVISTPNTTIDYIVSGTDILGCSNTDTITISVIQSLQMTNTPSYPSVCEGESVSIFINGASSFSWFPPNGLNTSSSNNVLASPLNTTNYMVIGTDNFGCSDTIYVNVDVLTKPNINITNNPSICEGESVPLIANGADNYSWFPPNGLNTIIGSTVTSSPLTSTSYSVVGTLNNGCSDTISTVVSVNPNPILTTLSSNVDLCKGDTTILLVSGASNYIWSPTNSLSNINTDTTFAFPITNTNYSVLGMDSLGCSSMVSINVNVYDLPTIAASSLKPEICIGENTLLSATGGIHYNWSPSFSLSSANGNTVSANPSANTTYMVVGTDINQCSSWDTLSVSVNPIPVLSINNTSSTICEGENISLIVTGANTYVWSPSLGLNTSIGNNVLASPVLSTTYDITGTDLNGCSDIISSNVIVNPSPSLSLSPNNSTICTGESIQVEVFGADTYIWSPSFGLSSTNSNIVVANPNSSITYNVVGIDGNLCMDSIEFELNIQAPPTILVSPNSPVICEGESVTLIANGATTYSWSPSNTLSSDIGSSVVSTPQTTLSYQVIGRDNTNCKDTIIVDVSVIPLPTANIVSGGGIVCSGDSAAIVVDLTGNPDWEITYSVDGTVNTISSSVSPTIIYSVSEGNYTIPFVSDANECTNIGTGSQFVDIINKPQANIDFNPQNPNMLNPEVSFANNSIFANSYLWQFGDNTPNSIEFEPVHFYEKEGVYQVVLLAENGPCTDTSFVKVVVDPYYALYVPNTFTPNDDGRNDEFEPKGVGIDSYEIYIFNRWGNEVFYSDNILNCWDGGKGVLGTYSYIINIVDKLGEFHKKTGFVLIE